MELATFRAVRTEYGSEAVLHDKKQGELIVVSVGSAHHRFGHENIWFAESIGIWDNAHNHIAQFLIKLVGMLLQVPDVSDLLVHMGKKIDLRKGRLLIFVV